MTETHKIRSPEWSHIHERDNRILERDNRILELEAANATLRRQLEAAECGGVAWNTIVAEMARNLKELEAAVDNLTDFDLDRNATLRRQLEAANATLRRQLEAAECGGVAWNTIVAEMARNLKELEAAVDNLTDFDLDRNATLRRQLEAANATLRRQLEKAISRNATLRRQLEEEKEQTSELRAFLEARELARLFASRTRRRQLEEEKEQTSEEQT